MYVHAELVNPWCACARGLQYVPVLKLRYGIHFSDPSLVFFFSTTGASEVV